MALILSSLLVFIFSVWQEQSFRILACRTTAKQCGLLYLYLFHRADLICSEILEQSLRARNRVHRKKSFSIFPSTAGMSLTKLSLGGNNDVIYKLFPPGENLVCDIPAEDGNIEKLFYSEGKGLSYRPARLAASIPWKRFLGSLKA